MRKSTFVIGTAIFVVALMAVGGLFASNMGFKLNYGLRGGNASLPEGADGGDGISNTGQNTLGLPYNRQTGIDFAQDLADDIEAECPGAITGGQIQRWNENPAQFETHVPGPKAGQGFALASGEGLFLKLNDTQICDYIVVGSHNPDLEVPLEAGSDPGSETGQNLFSYAYHQTALTAQELADDIPGMVAQVQRWNRDLSQFETHIPGPKGGPGFDLTPGQSYFLKMDTNANYRPSHF